MDETIDTYCPNCHDRVDVPLADATLLVPTLPQLTRLAFICPDCGIRTVKPLPSGWADRLSAHGVTAERVDIPSEAFEIHHGPPINEKDVKRFLKELETY